MLKVTLVLLALGAGAIVSTVAVMGMLGGGDNKVPATKYKVTCGCHYPRIYSPVCASDDFTYDNAGYVRCVNICNENTNLTVLYKGACKEA